MPNDSKRPVGLTKEHEADICKALTNGDAALRWPAGMLVHALHMTARELARRSLENYMTTSRICHHIAEVAIAQRKGD